MRTSWLRFLVCAVLGGVVGGVGGVGVVPGASTSVHACSCVEETDESAFERASVVFVGAVTAVDRTAVGGGSMDPVRYTMTVSEVYKGTAQAEQDVVTATDSASCGTSIGSGDWLIFGRPVLTGTEAATGEPRAEVGDVRTNLCSGNRALAASSPVPVSFGSPSAPTPTTAAPTTTKPALQAKEDRTGGYIVMVGAVVVFVVGFVIVARRARRR